MRILLPLSLVLLFLLGRSIFAFAANQSVIVSAVVGNSNHAPVVLSVVPANDPKLLAINKIQNFSLYFRDNEKDTVSYTITPNSGFASPISATINPSAYDTASGAYINFTYLAPSGVPTPNPTTVTVTINDGTNLVTKNIRLYIY